MKSRRNSAKMLACVMALALVACAIVAFVPSAEESDAAYVLVDDPEAEETVFDGSEDLNVLYGGGKYVITGDVTAIVDTPGSDGGSATVILMAGASLTINGSNVNANSPDIVVYSAVSQNYYETTNSITFAVASTPSPYTVTVSAPDTYPEDKMGDIFVEFGTKAGQSAGSTVPLVIGTDVTVTITGEVDLVGVVKSSSDTVANLNYAVGVASGNPADDWTFYGDAETVYKFNSSTTDITYTVNSEDPVTFQKVTVAEDNTETVDYAFTVTKVKAAVTVKISSGVPSITNGSMGSENGTVKLITGQFVDSGDNDVIGMTAAVSVYDGTNTTYYADDKDADLDGLNTSNKVTIWNLSSETIVGGTSNGITNSVTVAAGTYAGATVTYTEGASGSVKVIGKLDIITYNGTLASEGETALDVEYGYAKKTSANVWSYYKDPYSTIATGSLTDGATYLIKKVAADGAVLGNISFSKDFASTDFQVNYTQAGSVYEISGTWTAGTVTVTGAVSVAAGESADKPITLTVPSAGAMVIDGTAADATLNVPENAVLAINGPISSESKDSYVGSVKVSSGKITGTANVSEVTIIAAATADLANIAVDYDYTTSTDGSNNLTLAAFGTADELEIAASTTYTVYKVPGAIDFGTTSAEVFTVYGTFGDNFKSAAGVNIKIDSEIVTIVSGTYSGDLSINGANITALTVGVAATSASGDTPAKDAVPGNLSIRGTVTITAMTIDAGTVTVEAASDAGVTPALAAGNVSITNMTNNATFVNNGTVAVTAFTNNAKAIIVDNGTWTGSNVLTNNGTIVTEKANALGIVSVVKVADSAAGIIADAAENPTWTYKFTESTGSLVTGTLTLNGNVKGQYFSGTITQIDVMKDSTVDVTGVKELTTGAAIDNTGAGKDLTIGLGENVTSAKLTVNTDGTSIGGIKSVGKVTITGMDLVVDSTGAAVNGTEVKIGDGVGAVTDKISVDISGGIVSTGAVSLINVSGTIVGSVESNNATASNRSVTISYSDLAITAGEDKETIVYGSLGDSFATTNYGKLVITSSNLDLRLPEETTSTTALTIAVGASADANYKDDTYSTIIVDGLNANKGVNSLIVVTGGLYSKVGDDVDRLYAYNGLESEPVAGSVYLYGGKAGAGAFGGSVTSPVPAGADIVNNLEDALASTSTDIVFIAQNDVSLDALTISKNLTISTNVTGDVTVAAGYTLTVGGNYADAKATVNGTLAITGALNGTVNKTDFANVTGITYTAGTGTANDVISMTAGVKEIKTGSITVDDGETVVIAKGVKLVEVSVNGTSLTITAMADMTVSVPKVAEPEAPEQGTEGSDSAAPASMRATAYAEPATDGDATTEPEGPKLTITGDFQMDASMTGVNGIEISDATITSGSKDPETVYEITIAAEGTLYLSGTINLDGVKIVVGDNTTLVIAKDAVINGDEGSIELDEKGKIVNNGGTISAGVVDATAGSATVTDMTGFLAALPYYDKITVQGTIELKTTDGTSVDYYVDNVDIVLNHGMIVVKENVNLVFNEANVEINDVTEDLVDDSYADIESGITVEGTIQVNNSDIYVDVVADDENVVPGEGNTMNVSGTSTGLGRIGFGNTLVIDDAFTLGNRTGDLTVYGTVQVNSGVTLSISQGTTMTVSKSGVLNVLGAVANAGNIVVKGTADVAAGASLTVTGTGLLYGTGTVDVTGTLNMNGTSGVDITIQQDGNVTVNGNVTYGNGTTVTTDDINTDVTIYPGANLNIEKATGTMTVSDEGTVADYKAPAGVPLDPTQDGNTVTLENAANYQISTSVGKDSQEYGEKTYEYDIAVMDIAGTAAEGDVTANAVTGLTVAGTLEIAKGSFEITGIDVEVAGTVTVAVGATFSSDADLEIAGTVEVSEATAVAAVIDGTGKVTATYYDVTTPAAGDVAAYVTKTYTTFDNAVAAIAGADKTTVTVSGEQTATVSAENVAGTVVINDGAKLTVGAATGDIVVLSFAATGGITNNDTAAYDAVGSDGNNVGKNIVVYGELTFADYTKYVEGASTKVVETPKIAADVVIIDDKARTFTTLANALKMDVEEITLNQKVTITGDVVIPAGKKVVSDTYGIDVANDASLTVRGGVELSGAANTITAADEVAATQTAAKKEAGKIAVEYKGDATQGYIYVINESDDLKNVAGAHYTKTVTVPAATAGAQPTEYPTEVVSALEFAAADKDIVVSDSNKAVITIVGTVTVGGISFAVPAPEDENDKAVYTLDVILADKAVLTADSVNIVPGVTVNGTAGTITGSVESAVGTVDLNKVAGITVVSVAAVEDEKNPVPEMLTISGTDVKGDVTVSAGTVTVKGTLNVQNPADKASSSLTVAADATLDVDGAVYTADKVPVTVNGTMDIAGTAGFFGKATVTGTVSIKGEGAAIFNGETTVNGEITVEGAKAATSTEEDDIAILAIYDGIIAGTIDANEYSTVLLGGTIADNVGLVAGKATVTGTVNAEGILVLGDITVGDLGEGSYELGTALTGEINVTALEGVDDQVHIEGIVKAYYGTTVTGLGDDVKSTAYVINGKTYMTVYAGGQATIMSMIDGTDLNLTENGLALDTGLYYGDDEKDTGLYNPANWYKTSNMLPNTILTGSEYIGDANAKTVYAQVEPVPVTVTVTVGEGITMYIDGIPYISGSYDLTVGPHEVLLQAQAGFTVEKATVTLYKGTEATTVGDSFTLDAGDENVKIVALGAEQTSGDITIDVPGQEPPVIVTNGDDEMSLTDYLLIVLVVLIVIMAIIVALRLMRS